MEFARLLSTVMFQTGESSGSDHSQLLVIFVGVIAFCSFVQFLVLVGAAIAALKAYKSVSAEIGVLKQKAMPLVDSVQTIVSDATPKVKKVTDNVVQVSEFVKTKLQAYEGTIDEANQTLKDANSKTRAQVARVDGMVSSTLKATSDLGTTIHKGIKTPVLEVAGVVNGLKAALDVLVGRSKGFGAGQPQNRSHGAPGPVRVPSAESAGSSHPSSNVAPSPGAAAVVDHLWGERGRQKY